MDILILKKNQKILSKTNQIPKPELVLLPFFFFPPSHFLHCCYASMQQY